MAQLFQAFRFKIVYCSNDYILYFMIIVNIVLSLKVSTACLSHDHDLHEIKVVYDHTRIASYRHSVFYPEEGSFPAPHIRKFI